MKNLLNNFILRTDAYKYSHSKFYNPKTQFVYSYCESRGGKFDSTVFFGLQYYIKEYLLGQVVTKEMVDEADEYLFGVFGSKDVFDRSKWDYIVEKHGGRLPIKIRAVREGTLVPVKNVLFDIVNTDPECYWVTNFVETLLLKVWYPITVSTLSYNIRKVAKEFADKSSDNPFLDFFLNDFGYRGVSSEESAGLGGMSHLLNFRGSDTIRGSVFASTYYNTKTVWGLSIPATEHSIMTQEGEVGEPNVIERVLNTIPKGMVAIVSDSYDITRTVDEYFGNKFKQRILDRDGVLVIRPDSGSINRTLQYIFNSLFNNFGFTLNKKGYKVLPSQIRVIQGDGVNYNSIKSVLEMMDREKISIDNIVFGMGGKLLQSEIDRDTQNFAIKASWTMIDGKEFDVVKSPLEINDLGQRVKSFKISKKGKLKLVNEDGVIKTIPLNENNNLHDLLLTVFENGEIINEWTFEECREYLNN